MIELEDVKRQLESLDPFVIELQAHLEVALAEIRFLQRRVDMLQKHLKVMTPVYSAHLKLRENLVPEVEYPIQPPPQESKL